MANPYEPPRSAPPTTIDPASARAANWALALGIASLFLCAPLLGPLAIWKATHDKQASGRATAGIVFGLLGLLASLMFWFLVIWQFLTPAERPH